MGRQAEVGEELFADKDEKAGNPWLFKAFYQGGPKVKQGQSAEDVLFQMQSEIIRELAEKEDCIIVGRCADLVLTGQDVDCLSLFICAPFEWRVHHRMELENLDEKAARTLVEKTDAQREKYYTHYTGRPWGLPENYDICINSARLGIDRTDPDTLVKQNRLPELVNWYQALGAEALVLGCTHFPYFKEALLRQITLPLIDPAEEMLRLLNT